MIATEVPRGRSSARSVDDAARDLENVGTYVEAQLAAGRPIDSVLATQADALHHRLHNLAAEDLHKEILGDLTKQQQRQWQHR